MNESEMRAALPVLTPLITSNNDDICSEAIGCIERITDVIQPSEALAIAVGLRNLFEHTNPEIRYTALSTYVGLLSRFNNSLEAENERHSGIVAIRHLFSDPDQRVAEFAIDHYVTTLYAVPSPQWQIREANQGARCLREALATGHADFNRNITRNYFELVRTPFFQNQRNEIITCMRLTENPDPDIRGNALELLDYLIDLNLEHGIVSPVFARFRAVYEDPNENDSVRIIAARNFFPHLARLSESERMEVLASTRRICLNSELSNEARGAIGWIYTNGLLDELDSGEAFSEAQTLRQSFNNSNPEVVSWAVLAYRDLFDRLPPDELILAIQALNGDLSTEDDNLILISY